MVCRACGCRVIENESLFVFCLWFEVERKGEVMDGEVGIVEDQASRFLGKVYKR
jgi:hypothetical protein